MKKIGITRKTDFLGRIVLPIEMRRALEWDEHTELEFFAEQDGVFCGNISLLSAYFAETIKMYTVLKKERYVKIASAV